MSHPIIDLRRLLLPATAVVTGTVIALENVQVRVATAKGIIVASRRAGDATVYAVGTDVKIQADGTVQGRVESGQIYIV